jgi:hypothetical protein
MTIVSSTNYEPSLTERQEYTVMTMLDHAINSPTSIDTHELAGRLVGEVHELEVSDNEAHAVDDLERLRIFVTTMVAHELDKAGGMMPIEYAEFEVADWAADIACTVRDEVARGPECWRDDLNRDRFGRSI